MTLLLFLGEWEKGGKQAVYTTIAVPGDFESLATFGLPLLLTSDLELSLAG